MRNLIEIADRYERSVILEALARNDWKQGQAAKELRIPAAILRAKIKRLGIIEPGPPET